MLSDKFAEDPDWKALVVHKQKFTPTKEWADAAIGLLKDKIESNAYAILLYDALTHEIIKIEERIRVEDAEGNKQKREEFRRKLET